MIKIQKGILVEYSLAQPQLSLEFDFNPSTISRTRSASVSTGETPATRGGYDFTSPLESDRAAHGVSMQAETFSINILLDATDRMNEGDSTATKMGVQPEVDTLRAMVEPKVQSGSGVRLLASLGAGETLAVANRSYASVILFVWGQRVLPVFLTSVQIEETAHLPTLMPYRAEVTIQMQVIESQNPFYKAEVIRQSVSAARNTMRMGAEILAGTL